jgi:hypothetical protein
MTLFDYLFNSKAKTRVGGMMLDHIMNDLFKVVVVVVVVEFYTRVLLTSE